MCFTPFVFPCLCDSFRFLCFSLFPILSVSILPFFDVPLLTSPSLVVLPMILRSPLFSLSPSLLSPNSHSRLLLSPFYFHFLLLFVRFYAPLFFFFLPLCCWTFFLSFYFPKVFVVLSLVFVYPLFLLSLVLFFFPLSFSPDLTFSCFYFILFFLPLFFPLFLPSLFMCFPTLFSSSFFPFFILSTFSLLPLVLDFTLFLIVF